MLEPNKPKRQEIRMVNRKLLEITGVLKVESFDNEQFLLETECGFLRVKGSSLHMNNLSLEQRVVIIEGLIDELHYLDGNAAHKSKGLMGKLFR
jgi:sporulation protein YabP